MNKPIPNFIFAGVVALAVLSGVSPGLTAQETKHITRDLEGWTVEIDSALTAENDELGQKLIRVVSNQLFDLKERLPAELVADLQTIVIRIDRQHELRAAQYHPSRRWLEKNGHDPKLARKVHLPNAQNFIGTYLSNQQPYVVLHELAHAYHDQFLGFDNEEIKAVYLQAISDNKYDRVLHVSGRLTEHYGKTNHKEFFAEMTEAYLGTNDFYPFVRGELKQHDRRTYELLEKVWR